MVLIVSVGTVYHASADFAPGVIGIGSTARAALNDFHKQRAELMILLALAG